MQKIFILLSFWLMGFFTKGQDYHFADSLRKLLSTNIDDTTRFLAISRLSIFYLDANLDSSMYYAEKSYQLSLTNNAPLRRLRGIMDMADVLWRRGNHATSLEFYFKGLELVEPREDSGRISVIYSSIAGVYKSQNDNSRAIEYYLKSFKLSPPPGTTVRNDRDRARSHMYLGEIYFKLNRLDSALYHAQQSYEIATLTGENRFLPISLKLLGDIQKKAGNINLALEYYRVGITTAIKYENAAALSDNYLAMSKLFNENKLMDSAYIYASRAFDVAKRLNNIYSIEASSEILNQIFEEKNKPDSAYKYLKFILAAKDSLINLEKIQQVQNLYFNENLRQQEMARAKIVAQEERKKNLQFVAIATFIVFFTIGFILLSRKQSAVKLARFLGIVGLLLVFEFIALLTHPWIEKVTHHSPIWSLLLLVLLASILVPAHHYFEKLIKENLTKRQPVNSQAEIIAKEEEEENTETPTT